MVYASEDIRNLAIKSMLQLFMQQCVWVSSEDRSWKMCLLQRYFLCNVTSFTSVFAGVSYTPNRNGSTVRESLPQYLLYRDQFQFKSSISFVKGETSRCNIIISHLSNVFSSKLFFYICIKPYSRYSHFFSLSKAFPLDIQTFEVS